MPDITIPEIDNEDIGTLLNTRAYSQYCEMYARITQKKCPFCELDARLNKILKTEGTWSTWKNPFPHAHTKEHFVIAPIRHLTHLHDMSWKDWDEFSYLVDWAVNAELGYGLKGGCLAMRFGDPNLNAGSVRHLHANIIVPDGTGQVRVTIAKDPSDIEKAKRRIQVFEKMRVGTKMEDLKPDEIDLVKDRMG